MKKSNLLIVMLLSSFVSFAQTDVLVEQDVFVLPQFLIVILAGVLLALGFQIILTAISIASGITAIGDVRETYIRSKHNFGGKNSLEDDSDNNDEDSMNTGLAISTAFGVWSLVTVSLSLFIATLLAIKLVVIADVSMAITLSLVIWSTFLMILFYFESRMANTLIGGLVGLATSGLKASGNTIKNLFSTSDSTKVQHVIDNSIKKIRSEFDNSIDLSQFKNSLDQFGNNVGNKIDNAIPSYDQLKKDLKEILNETSSSNQSQGSGAKLMVLQQVINEISRSDNEDENKASKSEKLKSLYNDLKAEYDKGDTSEEKAKNIVQKLSPADEETTNKYLNKVFNYFKSTESSKVDSNSFMQLFNELKNNPSQVTSNLSQKMAELDKATIVNLLNENTSYNKEQIENNVTKVQGFIEQAKEQLNKISSEASAVDLKKKLEDPVARFVNSSANPQLNYNIIKYDIQRAINNPNDALSIVKNRAKHFDTDTFISLIISNSSLEKQDFEDLKNKIENTKSEILNQVTSMEEKAKLTLENAKRKTVIEAEHLRKIAVSAAWWLVFTALFSGAAAVVGGMISL